MRPFVPKLQGLLLVAVPAAGALSPGAVTGGEATRRSGSVMLIGRPIEEKNAGYAPLRQEPEFRR